MPALPGPTTMLVHGPCIMYMCMCMHAHKGTVLGLLDAILLLFITVLLLLLLLLWRAAWCHPYSIPPLFSQGASSPAVDTNDVKGG